MASIHIGPNAEQLATTLRKRQGPKGRRVDPAALAASYEVASFDHHIDIVKEGQGAPAPLTVRVCDGLAREMGGAGFRRGASGASGEPSRRRG